MNFLKENWRKRGKNIVEQNQRKRNELNTRDLNPYGCKITIGMVSKEMLASDIELSYNRR